jgi:hypothetical protein
MLNRFDGFASSWPVAAGNPADERNGQGGFLAAFYTLNRLAANRHAAQTLDGRILADIGLTRFNARYAVGTME